MFYALNEILDKLRIDGRYIRMFNRLGINNSLWYIFKETKEIFKKRRKIKQEMYTPGRSSANVFDVRGWIRILRLDREQTL